MSRVFITQQAPNFDFSSAEELGKPVAIWAPGSQAYGDTRFFADAARRTLADFDPEEDYLLPVGDPALMCMAAAEVALVTGGVFRVLKWDRRAGKSSTGGYRVIEVDLDSQPV